MTEVYFTIFFAIGFGGLSFILIGMILQLRRMNAERANFSQSGRHDDENRLAPHNSTTTEIRALAARAREDSLAEELAANTALVRSEAYLDKYHELMALAARCEAAEAAKPS